MLKFDPQTYTTWKEKGVGNISIEFISSGCEGTSIKISENTITDGFSLLNNGETHHIAIYTKEQDQKILENAYITHTGGKWILKSEEILTRCGCGKSFGIKTGDPKIDKIRLLKSKLSKSKSHH
ncbi:hypothetical protein K2X92_00935 [Candidatus Gracilibacteria bacterium]|nr:hypothetical protein [Candidatus Gracilibacteria bacterium]